MHILVIMFLVVYALSMCLSFLMWKSSKRFFTLLPTDHPWHSAFYSVLASTVLLYFSKGVQELSGMVLIAALPVLSVVLTATAIVVLNLFRRNSQK